MTAIHDKVLKSKAVLFDWDGTLVNSSDFVPSIHAQILSELGIPLNEEDIRESLGISQTALLRRAILTNGFQPDEDKITTVLIPQFVQQEDKMFDDYYCDGRIGLLTGVTEFLRILKENKVPTAIVSNAYDTVTHKRLHNTGLMGGFFNEDDVFGRTRVGTTKPNPLQILTACQAMGCLPKEAVFFGDTQSDRGACEAAGISMIQVGRAQVAPPSFAYIDDFQIFANMAHEKRYEPSDYYGPAPQKP
jgi:phosphoglycolate phosphatase